MDNNNAPAAVRPPSREPRFKRVRALQCFEEVHNRLLAGWPAAEIARFVQEERKEYDDVTRSSLVGILNDYRSSIPKAELIARRMPNDFLRAKEAVEQGLNELHELEMLYKKQMDRIGIDLATEKKINKLMPTMTQEMKAAREMLETYAQLKMDLGLTKRHIGQVELDAHLLADVAGKYGKESVVRVLGDPESRRKVLHLAEKMLSRQVDSTVVDVEPLSEAELSATADETPEVSPGSLPSGEPSGSTS